MPRQMRGNEFFGADARRKNDPTYSYAWRHHAGFERHGLQAAYAPLVSQAVAFE